MWIGQVYNVVCLDLLSHGINIRFSDTPVSAPLPHSEAHHSLFEAHRHSHGIRAVPGRRKTDVTRWKVNTTEKPGASRKWASPRDEETELDHEEKGKWGWCWETSHMGRANRGWVPGCSSGFQPRWGEGGGRSRGKACVWLLPWEKNAFRVS